MALEVLCPDCRQAITVEAQMIANAVVLGQELSFSHGGHCPGTTIAAAPVEQRRFRLQILAYELGADEALDPAAGAFNTHIAGAELVSGIGKTVVAPTLQKAIAGPLTTWLADPTIANGDRLISGWELFQSASAYADATPTGPAEDAAEAPPEDAAARGPGGAVPLG